MKSHRKSLILAIVATGILALATAANAATFTVTRLSDTMVKGTLRWAITQAQLDPLPDTIVFNTQGTVVLTDSLPWIDTPITINGAGIVINANHTFPIFGVGENWDSSSFGDLTLSRVTLANGASDYAGGAIYSLGGSVTATNCTFRGNSASVGGAIYALPWESTPGSLTLTGCTFTGNTALAVGGAVVAIYCQFSATDCTFRQNSCVAPPDYQGLAGGGALVYFADMPGANPFSTPPALVHCTFTGNTVSSNSGGALGGAIAGYWINATRCTFRNNVAISTAVSQPSLGGAIGALDGALVTDCAFAHNRAGDLTVDPALYPSSGGAIATLAMDEETPSSSFAFALNCSFGANSAGDGSAVASDFIALANCIVWGNPSATGNQLSALFGQVLFSDVQLPDGEVIYGPGNINANPRWLLNPQQGDQDNVAGILQLLEGSPCIDAGSNVYPLELDLTVDLLGRNRFINDPDTPDSGEGDPPIVDMGAYEFRP